MPDTLRSCYLGLATGVLWQETIPVLKSIGHKFTDSSKVGVANLMTEDELWLVSLELQQKRID